MQRYEDFGLVPNNMVYSYSSCCDRILVLRHTEVKAKKGVAKTTFCRYRQEIEVFYIHDVISLKKLRLKV
jgi:hypothetical protein